MSYTVAQNTSFLTFASVAQKIVSFAYFTLIAHLIGVGNTGSYFFAITFTTIFTVVADFGLQPVLTREIAKYPGRANDYLSTVFTAKFLFGLVTYGLVVGSANLLRYPDHLKELIYLSGITMFFDNIQGCFYSIFRAMKNLVYESAAVVASQIMTLVIGTTALFFRQPLIWLIAAYAIPSAVLSVVGAFMVRKYFGLKIRFRIDSVILKYFIATALPFAAAGILGRLYSYSDSLLMSKLLTPNDMGWWSVPYKITFAFQFIPVALSASVYPAMSSLSVTEPGKIGALFTKAWKYLFIIVFPLSFGLMAVSHQVITRLYGQAFLPSVPVLRVLLVSLIFSYLAIISGSLLNATGRQSTQTTLVGLALFCNIVLNLILIPRLGIIGAAYAALISNVLLWTLGLYFVRKTVVLNTIPLLSNGMRVLTLAIIMAILVYFLTLKFSFIITIPVGVVFYGVLLLAVGIVDLEKIMMVIQKISIKKVV